MERGKYTALSATLFYATRYLQQKELVNHVGMRRPWSAYSVRLYDLGVVVEDDECG